jgi:predicted enzyme related to lactoylglutathione lyase
MSNAPTLRGFATLNIFAADHPAAVRWYAELLGRPAYFEKPGYAEFRFGDYEHELGVIDRKYAPAGHTDVAAGVVAYWHVEDVAGMLARLLAMGASQFEGVTERGGGFVTASVVDPYGNILGVMYNPHYVKVLAARG